jgi:hypothetical protein
MSAIMKGMRVAVRLPRQPVHTAVIHRTAHVVNGHAVYRVRYDQDGTYALVSYPYVAGA